VVVLRGLGQAPVMALGSAVVALAAAGLWRAAAGGAHPMGVVLFVCLPLAVAGSSSRAEPPGRWSPHSCSDLRELS
jgi:hypothetical protein